MKKSQDSAQPSRETARSDEYQAPTLIEHLRWDRLTGSIGSGLTK